MRILLVLALTFSASAFADDFEDKIKEIQEQADTELMHMRVKTKSLPNDEYVQKYKTVVDKRIKKETELFEELCKTKSDDPSCISEKEFQDNVSSLRVLAGLEGRKNEWAKEGLSKEEIKAKEALVTTCLKENKDCDKLDAEDKEVASAKPFGTPILKSEEELKEEAKKKAEKPEAKATASAKPKVTKPKVSAKTDSPVTIEAPEAKADEPKKIVAAPKSEEEEGEEEVVKIEAKTDPKAKVKAKEAAKEEDSSDEEEDEKADPKATAKGKADAPKAVAKAPAEKPEATIPDEINEDEKSPRNYKPDTCKWVTDLPRKVVNGPGCGPKGRSKMCTGYVSCEQKQGGARFIRMSTCGSDKCGSTDEDAVKCTKDMAYFSMKPQGEEKLFMTPKLKKVLNGTSRQ
jgi:hypothetical protein